MEKSDAPIQLPDNHADLRGGGPGGGAGGQLWAEPAVGAAADLHSAAVSDPGADAVPQSDFPDGLCGPAAGGNAPDDGDDAVDGFPDAVWPERRGRLLALRGGGAYGSADGFGVCRNSGPGHPGSLPERPAADPDPMADLHGFPPAAERLPDHHVPAVYPVSGGRQLAENVRSDPAVCRVRRGAVLPDRADRPEGGAGDRQPPAE